MGRDVRFLIVNRDESCSGELRAVLSACENTKVVAEVDEPALLGQAAKQFLADAILVNLDPQPDAILPAVGELAAGDSDVVIFATSESTDGPLILKTMRMGAKEFLPKPIDAAALTEAVHKFTRQKVESTRHGKLVTVVGAAGGVGSTVLATNLAVELADISHGKVVVVDLDFRFGQVATMLDVEPRFTLSDLCESPEAAEPMVIDRALVKHGSGVRVLSRPSSFAAADTMTAASCVGLLSVLVQNHDYVVVDGPARSDVCAKSVLDIADVNLLLVQLLVPCVRNASRMLEGIRDGSDTITRTRLIPNRVGRDSADLSVDDVAKTLDLKVFASIPDEWATVSGSINLGEPLKSYGPKSKVRAAIRELAENIHEPTGAEEDKDGQKKSLIGRIFATG